jgi:hypothetical protein
MVAVRAYVLRGYLVRESATLKAFLATTERYLTSPPG